MPPSGLHFEHSFYVETHNIKYLLEKNGFQINKITRFHKHSLFIKATSVDVSSPINELLPRKLISSNKLNILNFNKTISHYKKVVKQINKKLADFKGETYIYGSHFPAQFLCYLGLNNKKIIG